MVREVHSGETVSGVVKPVWSEKTIDTAALPDGVREFGDGKKFYYLDVRNGPLPGPAETARWKEEWAKMLGTPASNYDFPRKCELYFKFSRPGYDGELYRQNNAPGKVQETMLLLPRQGKPPQHTAGNPSDRAKCDRIQPGYCMKPRSNRNNPAAVWDLQNPRHDNAVIGLRFYKPLRITVSPRFFAFFKQYPG